jgi:hypothetical protein
MARGRWAILSVLGSLAVYACGAKTGLDGAPEMDAGKTTPQGSSSSSSGGTLIPDQPDAGANYGPCIVPGGGSGGPGATPVLLAQLPAPAGIAVDATSAYVASYMAGPVYRMGLDGAGLGELGYLSATTIAVNSEGVYTVSPLGTAADQGLVVEYPPGASGLDVLAKGQDHLLGVAVDAVNVYWSNTDGIAGKTTGVFGIAIHSLSPGAGVFALSVAGPASQVVASAGRVFYAGATKEGKGAGNEGLMSVSATGGPVTVLVPPDPAYDVATLAVDCVNVYYTTTAGTLARIPIDGGTPTTLATGVGAALQLAVDADRVYFFGPDGLAAVPIGGGTVTTLAPGSTPAGIAVDANDVYWTEVDAGRVMKVAK